MQEGDRGDKLNLVAANAERVVKILTCREKRHLARCIAAVLSGISFFFPMPLRLFSTLFGCRSCQVILALVQRRLPVSEEGSPYFSNCALCPNWCARQLVWPNIAELALPSVKEMREALSALGQI